MRYKKTSQKNRKEYTYFFDGAIITLKAGSDGITDTDIKRLHAFDDAEVYNNLKNSRMPLSEKEKAEKEVWLSKHPGEQYPRRWNLSIEYSLDDEDEFANDKSQLSLATAVYLPEEENIESLVEDYIGFLTDSQKRAFWYVAVENHSLTETAGILGCSVANVSKLLKSARKRITAYYDLCVAGA